MDLETRLKFALYRYGDHYSTCPRDPCNCGFSAEWDAAALPRTFLDVARIAKLRELPTIPNACLICGADHGNLPCPRLTVTCSQDSAPENMVGDMSRCRHGDFQGYCTECNELCPRCAGSGAVKAMTQEFGPDDYEYDAECPRCWGLGLISRQPSTVSEPK